MKAATVIFMIALMVVLALKIVNIFSHFDDAMNRALNIAMFSLIGIAYIAMGAKWDKGLLKYILIVSGVYLVGMNFFEPGTALSVVGIACILVPMLIVRFGKKNKDTKEIA